MSEATTPTVAPAPQPAAPPAAPSPAPAAPLSPPNKGAAEPIYHPPVRIESFKKTAETPPPTPKDKTPEEIQAEVDQMLEGMGFGKPKRDKKPDEQQPPAPTAPAPAPAPVPAPEPEKKEGTPPPKEPAQPDAAKPGETGDGKPDEPPVEKPKKTKKPLIDPEAIRLMARDAAREALEAAEKPTALPAQPVTGGYELNDEQKQMLPVLEQMERENPTKYAGLASKTVKGWREMDDYRAKWQADNPGEKFNEDDGEYESFISEHFPDFDQTEYDRTETRLIIRSEQEAFAKKQRIEEAQRQLPGKIQQSVNSAVQELVKEADPELAKVGLEKLPETDKIAADAIAEVNRELSPLIAEYEKLTHPDLGYKPSESNGAYQFLQDFASRCEAGIRAMPVEQQLDDQGRRFATTTEYNAMSPERKANYWYLAPELVRFSLLRHFGQKAKDMIASRKAQARAYAESLGYKPPESVSKVTPTPESKEAAKPAPAGSKVTPAVVTSTVDSIKAGNSQSEQPFDLNKKILADLFS